MRSLLMKFKISPKASSGPFKLARTLSATIAQLSLTDTHNWYLKGGKLMVDIIKKYWRDTGTFDALPDASNWLLDKVLMVG